MEDDSKSSTSWKSEQFRDQGMTMLLPLPGPHLFNETFAEGTDRSNDTVRAEGHWQHVEHILKSRKVLLEAPNPTPNHNSSMANTNAFLLH